MQAFCWTYEIKPLAFQFELKRIVDCTLLGWIVQWHSRLLKVIQMPCRMTLVTTVQNDFLAVKCVWNVSVTPLFIQSTHMFAHTRTLWRIKQNISQHHDYTKDCKFKVTQCTNLSQFNATVIATFKHYNGKGLNTISQSTGSWLLFNLNRFHAMRLDWTNNLQRCKVSVGLM